MQVIGSPDYGVRGCRESAVSRDKTERLYKRKVWKGSADGGKRTRGGSEWGWGEKERDLPVASNPSPQDSFILMTKTFPVSRRCGLLTGGREGGTETFHHNCWPRVVVHEYADLNIMCSAEHRD